MRTRIITLLQRWHARLVAQRLELDPEAGSITVEVLGWAAMATVAIVAIGGALQALGVDMIDYVRGQLGL
jgi:hypothetical protein